MRWVLRERGFPANGKTDFTNLLSPFAPSRVIPHAASLDRFSALFPVRL
jgi:hypothetical protein